MNFLTLIPGFRTKKSAPREEIDSWQLPLWSQHFDWFFRRYFWSENSKKPNFYLELEFCFENYLRLFWSNIENFYFTQRIQPKMLKTPIKNFVFQFQKIFKHLGCWKKIENSNFIFIQPKQLILIFRSWSSPSKNHKELWNRFLFGFSKSGKWWLLSFSTVCVTKKLFFGKVPVIRISLPHWHAQNIVVSAITKIWGFARENLQSFAGVFSWISLMLIWKPAKLYRNPNKYLKK